MRHLSFNIKKTVRVLLLMAIGFMQTACSNTKDAYNHIVNQKAMDQLIDNVSDKNSGAIKGGFKETLAYYMYNLSDGMKTFVVIVPAVSIFIGIIGSILIKKDMKVRRVCILWFCILIPFLYVAATYVITYYAGTLL